MASTPPTSPQVSRRAVASGLSWAAPAVAMTTAAPAMAASYRSYYRFRGQVSSMLRYDRTQPGSCYNDNYDVYGVRITEIKYTNYDFNGSDGVSPRGFAITQLASERGSTSPQTAATVGTPLQLVVAYPQGLVNRNSGTNGFTFTDGTGSNWSGPTVVQRSMTTPTGLFLAYDVFTFTWQGSPTQRTVVDGSLTKAETAAWAGSQINGAFAPSPYYCSTHYAYAPGYGNTDWYYSGYYMNGTALSSNFSNVRGRMGGFIVQESNSDTAPIGPMGTNNWVLQK